MSEQEAMEHSGSPGTSEEEPSRGVKRKHDITVNPDTKKEVSDPKRPKIDVDPEKKLKCIKFMVFAYRKIIKATLKIESLCKNLSIGSQAANIVFSCHSILRQSANTKLGPIGTKVQGKEYTITSMGKKYTIKAPEAIKLVEDAAKEAGLLYDKYDNDDPKNWYGTIGPYLTLATCFDLRMRELRLGHSKMPISKEEGTRKSFNVSSYGLNGSHHILLEGCTYPPEKRSSIAQSLGPMTVLLIMIRTQKEYRQKWIDATKRAMSHLPYVDDLIDCVIGKDASELCSLLEIVADTLLITTSRQAQRMYFPINFYDKALREFKGAKGNSFTREGKTYHFGDKLLKMMSLSGYGGYWFYRLMTLEEWEIEGKLTPSEARQITFHSIFGTYRECLGVLSQITDEGAWHTREDFKDKFQKMRTSEQKRSFNLIKFKYVAKLCSANQTGLLASTYVQTTCLPVFSGLRRQQYGEDFFKQIARRAGATGGGKNIQQLIVTAQKTLDAMLKHLNESNNTLDMGTTSWHHEADLKEDGYGPKTNFLADVQGLYFLGRKNN